MLNADRVILRAIERTDLAQMLAWRNNPRLRQFFRERRELTMSDQNAWFDRVRSAGSDAVMFAIEARPTGRLVGACGLCYINWIDRTAEISIYVGAEGAYVDAVQAPSACRALIEHAFDNLNLHRLWAEVYEFDMRKQALFEALAFRVDGRLRGQRFHAGAHHDSLIFGRLRADPSPRDT